MPDAHSEEGPDHHRPEGPRQQLERWLGEQQQAYTYGLGQQGDATFWDWLTDRQPGFTDYYETGPGNPYMGGQRAAYRTRWLRR